MLIMYFYSINTVKALLRRCGKDFNMEALKYCEDVRIRIRGLGCSSGWNLYLCRPSVVPVCFIQFYVLYWPMKRSVCG